MHLTDLRPSLDAAALAGRLVPPRRFDDVRFSTYVPDPAHPSQQRALEELSSFASAATRPHRWWRRQTSERLGRYLDGGYGTGKTHLLASAWHACPGPKAYTTFGELTAFIGFVGMPAAIASLSPNQLLCIDEFELDDVANTLMVVTFLRGVMDQAGTKLVVTSNTLPDRLGEQRFTASEFRREIAAIAAHFDELSIDGDDFRTSHSPVPPEPLGTFETRDEFPSLMGHLRTLHPVQYGPLVEHLHTCTITGLQPVDSQDDALALVAFVDRLYDSCARVDLTGCDIEDLFSPSYRNGGYRKKYGRAESRLRAMQSEQR